MSDYDRHDDEIPETGVAIKTKPKTKKPSLYKVILLNDDYTPMEFVVEILESFFNKSHEEALQIMLHVHQKGVGICGVFPYEIAETKAIKSVSGDIKGDLSRYNEVKAFAQFGTSDLDQSTRNLLNRGEKLMEILKQGQYSPLPLEEETVALAAIEHVLDIPTSDARRFEEELLQYMRDRQPEVLATIRDSRDLSDETAEKMNAAIDTFRGTFKPSAG